MLCIDKIQLIVMYITCYSYNELERTLLLHLYDCITHLNKAGHMSPHEMESNLDALLKSKVFHNAANVGSTVPL